MDKAAESGVAAMAACYQGFDPSAYLQYNYTPPRADFQRKDSIVPWKLACLHRAFTEGEEEGAPSLYVAYIEILVCFFSSGDVGGELLVDVGSGPTLYQVLSGCEVFDKVLLTDFLEVNRQELKRWLQGGSGSSLDWTPYLQHVCQLEGRRYDRVLFGHPAHSLSSWMLDVYFMLFVLQILTIYSLFTFGRNLDAI